MLTRCSPRSRTSAVGRNGSASSTSGPFFPVKNAASSCSVPRATVPSTSGRALDPFLKNTLSRSGIAFGELCMSWRQPDAAAATSQKAKGRRQRNLGFNVAYLAGVEPLQKVARLHAVELRVRRFDQQEELVPARALEP